VFTQFTISYDEFFSLAGKARAKAVTSHPLAFQGNNTSISLSLVIFGNVVKIIFK
jgi:hypothetical protein